jgi:DNA-binding beta-propeller fold protein YncE
MSHQSQSPLADLMTVDAPPSTGHHAAPGATAASAQKRRRRLIALAVLGVLLLLVGSAFAWYLVTRKPLTALPGINVAQTPSYGYSIYSVTAPLGVAVTPEGDRIYVTQQEVDSPVLILDRTGQKIGELKVPPAVKGTQTTHTLWYAAIAPSSGEVFVSDRTGHAVQVYSPDGVFLRTIAPASLKGVWEPLGITVAEDGTLYVADVSTKGGGRILGLTQDGQVTRTLTVTGTGARPLNYPNGLLVDGDGNLVVADSSNARVLMFDKDGMASVVAGAGSGSGDVGMPRGLAIDDKGQLLVVDTTNSQVNVYKAPAPGEVGQFLGSFGVEGSGDGAFEYPNGIATDSRAKVYIADRVNNRIQVWSY